MSLVDKVVLITGAGRLNGIGAGIARCFANEGAKVVIMDLDGAPLDETAAAIPGRVTGMVADAADQRSMARAAERVLALTDASVGDACRTHENSPSGVREHDRAAGLRGDRGPADAARRRADAGRHRSPGRLLRVGEGANDQWPGGCRRRRHLGGVIAWHSPADAPAEHHRSPLS